MKFAVMANQKLFGPFDSALAAVEWAQAFFAPAVGWSVMWLRDPMDAS